MLSLQNNLKYPLGGVVCADCCVASQQTDLMVWLVLNNETHV